jgi:hypothetical protein
MKKILLILFISIQTVAFASPDGATRIYNLLDDRYDAFSLSLSKEMIDFFDLDIDMNGKEKWVTGDFTKGKLMTIDSEKIKAKTICTLFKDEKYEQIDIEDEMDEEDSNSEVYLFIERNGKNISQAHFVIENEENIILLSIYGDMQVKNKKAQ